MRNKLFIISILILTSISTIFAEKVKIGDLCYIPNAAEKTVEVISCDKPSKETRLIAYTSSNSSNTSSINSMTFDENIHQYRVSVREGYRLQPGDTIIIAKEMVRYLTGEESSEWVYYVRHVIAQVGGKKYPDGILVAGINSWIAYENAYLAGAVNKTAEALAQEKADQFQVETREAELVQKNEAELEEIRKKAESVGLEVLGSSTTDEYSPERSISDSKTATTPSTSAPTQQTAAATQNTAIATAKQIGRPLCTILSPAEGSTYSSKTIKLRYTLSNMPSEKYKIKYYVNEKERYPLNNGSQKGAQAVNGTEVELEMPIDNGRNASITIVMEDANQDERIIGRRTLKYVNVHKPTLHVFAVGVNKYRDKDFSQLHFAVKDAKNFVTTITNLADMNIYKEIDTTLIVEDDANRDNLEDQLIKLSQRIKSDDVVMLFFSGHGINTNEYGPYFITSDATKPVKGLSFNFINTMIGSMKNRGAHILVFMDACDSGAMANKGNTPIILAQPGVIGFYSSTAQQNSIEEEKLQNGVFTYALIQGIKNGKTTISELRDYIEKLVTDLTKERQYPRVILDESIDRDYIIFHKKK